MVAHFAQQGLETVPMTGPSRVSTDSLMAVVDAFAAVYDLRTVAITGRDTYYLGNLPVDCHPAITRGEQGSLTFASWNPIALWLRQLDNLRSAV